MIRYFKILLMITFMFILKGENFAQSKKLKFAEQFMLGTSLTYLLNYAEGVYTYHEWTWSLNASTNINKRFVFGLNNLLIQSHGTRITKEKFNLFGFYNQYAFLYKRKNRAYGELGLYWGNYCTCGIEDPYRVQGLNYLSLGTGYEWMIHENFSLEFGFTIYRILNNTEEYNYGYTQYIIGINYVLSK